MEIRYGASAPDEPRRAKLWVVIGFRTVASLPPFVVQLY